MKKILIASLSVMFVTGSVYGGKKYEGYEKTAHGLQYKIFKHGTGTVNAKVGDYIELNIQQVYSENDSVLMDSRKLNNDKPVSLKLQPANFDGDVPEGFTYMKEGDSAIFLIPIDTLLKKVPGIPPLFKPGNFLEFRVVMVSIKSEEQMKKEAEEKAAKQKDIDDKMLQDYFAKNNLKPVKTASGLYYIMHKTGTGPLPKTGQQVTVKYTGKLLDGKVFDSDVDTAFHHTDPLFAFIIGQHQVIAGWDEGVALLNKGGSATFYIPSGLAYGERGAGQVIAPYSPLIFDVEVTKIADQTTDQMIPTPSPGTKPTTPVNTKGRKMNTTQQK